MKKFTSKIVAVLAACACAVPMFSTISANAAIEQFNTYRVYYDAAESGIREFNIELRYDTNIKVQESELTNLCPEGTFTSVGNQDKGIYLTYYKAEEGTITETGTVATEDMLVPVNSEINNSITTIESNKYVIFECYAKDAYGRLMDSTLTYSIVLVGDSNGDGKIDMSDAVLIQQHIDNPTRYPMNEETTRRADVNGDGAITKEDADLIQKFKLELISHF